MKDQLVSEIRIPLPALSRKLKEMFGKTRPYTRLYRGALNGEYMVIQDDSGRYSVAEADLPIIAAVLGLVEPSA
jgi:hypothetical protein